MKSLLSLRLPLWLLIAVLLLFPAGLAIYGHVLADQLRGREETALGAAALALAEVPDTAKALIRGRDLDPRHVPHADRLDGPAGWTVEGGGAGLPDEGFLLLSRFSGDEDRHLVELVDLSDMTTAHVWRPDAARLFAGLPAQASLTRISQWGPFSRWNREYFEAVHPLLFANGDLVIKDHGTPLFRIDACAAPLWRQDADMFKHSTNLDAEGHLWVPSVIEPHDPAYGALFAADALTEVDPADGRILSQVSLLPVLEAAGYFPQMFGLGAARNDPMHMNDIEPVLKDGPYWKKGDLFLSIRHLSMIALYRPSEARILWAKQGPWMAQHDVDVIDDHRISVFSNNAYDTGHGAFVHGANEVLVYDFASGEVTSPLREPLAGLGVKGISEGLTDLTAAGNRIVEEENSGRLLIFAPDGRLLASYLNRAGDGNVFTLGWSRVVNRTLGEAALAAIAARGGCGGN